MELLAYFLLMKRYYLEISDKVAQLQLKDEVYQLFKADSEKLELFDKEFKEREIELEDKRKIKEFNELIAFDQKHEIRLQVPLSVLNDRYDKPKLNHNEFEILFQEALDINQADIELLLGLPRATLIEDLDTLINHGIECYGHYRKIYEACNVKKLDCSFMFYALLLASELKAIECLGSIKKLLCQSEDLMQFYFEYLQVEFFPLILFNLIDTELNQWADFIKFELANANSKSNIAEVIMQKYLCGEIDRETYLDIYKDIFEHFINLPKDSPYIDSLTFSHLVQRCIYINATELECEIEALWQTHYVGIVFLGNLDTVKERLRTGNQSKYKIEMLNIYEVHNQISEWMNE
jgi:hypothetical protein